MDKKGILVYLAFTLAASFIVQAIVISIPATRYLAYLLLLIPALGAAIARTVSPTGNQYPGSPVLGAPRGPLVRAALILPLLFAVVYLITTILGYSNPDWQIGELMARLRATQPLQAPEKLAPFLPIFVLALTFVISLVLGPTLYALLALGQEYGWRGYLLPRLMPLGRWRAHAICGLIWGLSLAPFILRHERNQYWAHFAVVLAMGVSLSALLGEVWRVWRHVGLTAMCLGIIACQATTVWQYLFPQDMRAFFPWAGALSITFAITWTLAAFAQRILFGPAPEPVAKTPAVVPAETAAE